MYYTCTLTQSDQIPSKECYGNFDLLIDEELAAQQQETHQESRSSRLASGKSSRHRPHQQWK